jgi:hypothetical protein
MRMWLEQKGPDISGPDGRSDEIIKLIRKLRWIGMEEEAARVQPVDPLRGAGSQQYDPSIIVGPSFPVN